MLVNYTIGMAIVTIDGNAGIIKRRKVIFYFSIAGNTLIKYYTGCILLNNTRVSGIMVQTPLHVCTVAMQFLF